MWLDPSLWLQALTQFFLTGGWVLFWLAWTAFVMWTLLLERTWFRWVQFPALKRQCMKALDHKTRTGRGDGELVNEVSGLQRELQKSFALIKTLVALCPMIGLLGTVTGMIQVFDVLAFHGTGNARLMSAGVAKATIPTMAGMVLAVSGLLMYTWLHHWSRLQLASLAHVNDGK